MINSAKIQRYYNRIYKEVRKYIWDFAAVEALADFEVAVYKTCPDLIEIQNKLDKFRLYTIEVEREDEDLVKAFNKFEELIKSDDTPFAKLYQITEVVQK